MADGTVGCLPPARCWPSPVRRGTDRPPGVGRALKAAARRVLPLGLSRQGLVDLRRHTPAHPHRRPGSPGGARACTHRCSDPGPAPARAGDIGPPVAKVAKFDRSTGGLEHERAGHEQRGVGVWEVRELRRALGHGDMAGRVHEAAKLRDRDGVLVDPEALDLQTPNRRLLRVEVSEPIKNDPAGIRAMAVGAFAVAVMSSGHRPRGSRSPRWRPPREW